MIPILDPDECKDSSWGFGSRRKIIPKKTDTLTPKTLSTSCLIDAKKCRSKRLGNTIGETRCRICNCTATRTLSNGKPIWIKDINVTGEWSHNYLCYKCAYENIKICCKCDRDLENSFRKKYYRKDGLWYGEYLCSKLHSEIIKHYV